MLADPPQERGSGIHRDGSKGPEVLELLVYVNRPLREGRTGRAVRWIIPTVEKKTLDGRGKPSLTRPSCLVTDDEVRYGKWPAVLFLFFW